MEHVTRRAALSAMGAGLLTASTVSAAEADLNAGSCANGRYTLPPLPYAYNALEPHLDEQTMRLHHDKHHQSYVDGANKALDKLQTARAEGKLDEVKALSRDLAFNGSGHSLHTIFWSNLRPAAGNSGPSGALAEALTRDFGSVDAFKAHFGAAARQVEGGGWAILGYEPLAAALRVVQAEKHQDLSFQGITPLLVLDVWEHAYYLKYQNNRGAYVDAWWNVVNWENVQARLRAAAG